MASVPQIKRIDGRVWELEHTSQNKLKAQAEASKIRRNYKNARVIRVEPRKWAVYTTVSIDKMISRGKYW